jgi:hypothetical protein
MRDYASSKVQKILQSLVKTSAKQGDAAGKGKEEVQRTPATLYLGKSVRHEEVYPIRS